MDDTTILETTTISNGLQEDIWADALKFSDRIFTIVGSGEQKKEMFRSWVQMTGEIQNPSATAINPFYKKPGSPNGTKYSPLNEVLAGIRPVLSKYGYGLSQTLSYASGGVLTDTILFHESGGIMFFPGVAMPGKKGEPDAQDIFGASTYSRRCNLNAILGIHGEDDDDGNSLNKPRPSRVAKNESSQPKKQTPASLTPLQQKAIDVANGAVKTRGVSKEEINEIFAAEGNPRTVTDEARLNAIISKLDEISKSKKINLKDV